MEVEGAANDPGHEFSDAKVLDEVSHLQQEAFSFK